LRWARSSKSKLSREKIVLATTNLGKFREIKEYLTGLPVEFLSLADLDAGENIEEEGKTFLENARLKSLACSLRTDFLTLAEDSGLEVSSLGGEPGIFSARFSAPGATDDKNIRKVLRLMEGIPWDERQARFVSCAVLSRKGKILKEVKGQVRGYIAFERKGKNGFGYDPIFFYPPWKRTFAEVSPAEKNKVSHRGQALKKMKVFLLACLKPARGEE
jgi:XTP/dITP diphosphohydrolase